MTQSETTSAAGAGETGLRKALNDAAFSIDGIGGAATPTPKLLRILADHLDGIRRIENVPGHARSLRGRADFLDQAALAARAALAVPTAKGGTDGSLDTWELAEERKRADLFVAKLNEAEGYATRLAQSLSDKHFPNPDWRPLPDLYGVLTQIDNMTTGLARKEPPPAGAAGGGSGDLGALSAACKPWEFCAGDPPDYDSPLHQVFVAGMLYSEKLLAGFLDVETYEPGDGSEGFDQDATKSLENILTAAGLYDPEEGRKATLAPTPDLGAQGEPMASKDLIDDLHDIADELSAEEYSEKAERIRDAIDEIERIYAAPAAPRTGSGVSEDAIVLLMAREWLEAKGGDGSTVESVGDFAMFSPEDYAACCEVARAILALFAQVPRDGGETQGEAEAAIRNCAEAVAFFDQVRAASEREQIAVGRDHWNWLESAARRVAACSPPSGVETIRQATSGGL